MQRLRHSADPICAHCEESLLSAHEKLGEWFRIVKKEFHDVHISCGYRGREEQEKAYSAGLSGARYPLSKHNCERDGKGCSEALDLFRLVEGKASFGMKYYEAIGAFSQAQGYSIRWPISFKGKDGKAKIDGPHFELI